jgi:hypothetical protein
MTGWTGWTGLRVDNDCVFVVVVVVGFGSVVGRFVVGFSRLVFVWIYRCGGWIAAWNSKDCVFVVVVGLGSVVGWFIVSFRRLGFVRRYGSGACSGALSDDYVGVAGRWGRTCHVLIRWSVGGSSNSNRVRVAGLLGRRRDLLIRRYIGSGEGGGGGGGSLSLKPASLELGLRRERRKRSRSWFRGVDWRESVERKWRTGRLLVHCVWLGVDARDSRSLVVDSVPERHALGTLAVGFLWMIGRQRKRRGSR